MPTWRVHTRQSESGARKYSTLNYMIRAKLNKGLVSGTMNMRSTFDDERIKYRYPESCCYCGSKDNIQMDHLIPQIKGGQNAADNLVWACRSCNSSKRNRDVLVWLESKGWGAIDLVASSLSQTGS